MQLRNYQRAAIDATLDALRNGMKRPLACLPTGSGKSPTICTLVHELIQRHPESRVLITTHTQELIGQLAATFERIAGYAPAVYSASLGRKELDKPVIIGQIQSVYRRMTDVGPLKLIVIDEAHAVPPEGNGQYRTMLKDAEIVNPDVRVCGWTATPYRLGAGLVFGPGTPFDNLVYDASIKQLIAEGYLSPLVSKDGGKPNLDNVHVSKGEYVQAELEGMMTDQRLVEQACDELCRYGADRSAWLIFASGVKHARMLTESLARRGIEAPTIVAEMDNSERKNLIERYRRRDLRALINVGILTTGFDAVHIDLVALLRPTLSPGLYYQMVGRGLRVCEGKPNCLILDMAGCIAQHGPIDTLNQRIKRAKSAKGKGEAPVKTCEKCHEIVPAGVRVCPACLFPFPPVAIAKHNGKADNLSPLSSDKPQTVEVKSVRYSVHASKDTTKPPTLRVDYTVGFHLHATEFISVDRESHSYARSRALLWLRDTPLIQDPHNRGLAVSQGVIAGSIAGVTHELTTAQSLLPFTELLMKPISLVIQNDGKYIKVIRRNFK